MGSSGARTCTLTHKSTCAHMHMHTCTSTHTHTHTHTHTWTSVHIFLDERDVLVSKVSSIYVDLFWLVRNTLSNASEGNFFYF